MDIKEFKKARKKYFAIVREKGIQVMESLFIKLFADNPDIKEVKWEQYTPYFNDGDACIFQVHDPSFYIEGEWTWIWNMKDSEYAGYDSIEDFTESFALLDEVLEHTFGDHSEVTVERDGDTVKFIREDYEHD